MKKPQVARQLKHFKVENYGNSQIEPIIDGDQLKEQMRISLSMEPIDYVVFTLEKILASRDPSSADDFKNFAMLLDNFPPLPGVL